MMLISKDLGALEGGHCFERFCLAGPADFASSKAVIDSDQKFTQKVVPMVNLSFLSSSQYRSVDVKSSG